MQGNVAGVRQVDGRDGPRLLLWRVDVVRRRLVVAAGETRFSKQHVTLGALVGAGHYRIVQFVCLWMIYRGENGNVGSWLSIRHHFFIIVFIIIDKCRIWWIYNLVFLIFPLFSMSRPLLPSACLFSVRQRNHQIHNTSNRVSDLCVFEP